MTAAVVLAVVLPVWANGPSADVARFCSCRLVVGRRGCPHATCAMPCTGSGVDLAKRRTSATDPVSLRR